MGREGRKEGRNRCVDWVKGYEGVCESWMSGEITDREDGFIYVVRAAV